MRSIVLTGARCTGKTGKGKIIADLLNVPSIDGDLDLLERTGYSTISDLINAETMEGFRRLESEAVAAVCKENEDQTVVFTPGGGAVAQDVSEKYRQNNVTNLQALGSIYYLVPFNDGTLHNSVELAYRDFRDPNSAGQRPRLTEAKDPAKELDELPIEARAFIDDLFLVGNKLDREGIFDSYKGCQTQEIVAETGIVVNELKEGGDFAKYASKFIDMYKTLSVREKIYRDVADLTILTGEMPEEKVANLILSVHK